MVQVCKHCRRANPSQAAFCHHDGVALDGGADRAVDVGRQPFSVPFSLPSGASCAHFNQLALALHNDPVVARDLFRKGDLERFLIRQGRGDLATVARQVARAADFARGLDEFLGQLPATVLTAARLRIDQPVLDLGKMHIGEDRRCQVMLHNEGMRLLFGSAECSDTPWLALGDTAALKSKLFECSDRTTLPVHVLGRHLFAFHKPLEAVIAVSSNGGLAKVTVRVQIDPRPFPPGVLGGAVSPREVADKLRANPREGAALLESGAIANWYQINGWTYPVQGPSATGIAIVQQFFEALGLAKPPRVEPSEDAIVLSGLPGTSVEYVLAVVTQDNRAVIAFGSSDQPWLKVGKTVFRGRSAMLPLTVPSVPGRMGDTLRANLSIAGNGNQKFVVPVTLVVANQAPPQAPFVSPPGPRAKAPDPAPVQREVRSQPSPPGQQTPSPSEAPPRRGKRALLRLLPALLLAATVAGAGLRDYFEHPEAIVEPDEVLENVPRIAIHFHDVKKNDELDTVYLTDPQPTMRFGVVMLSRGKEIGSGLALKRLTFDPLGRTNNTCLRFDNKDERLFGSSRGRWEETAASTWKDERGRSHDGTRSIWFCDDVKMEVTQFVELVRGEQSRLLDTCRVRYRIDNRDSKPHVVGLRFLLDSYIGGNDGVPFTVPGDAVPCDTLKDLPSQSKDGKVPDFLQALEKPDLAHPGTIAHLRLKLENLETPVRVTLGAWPNEKLRVLDRSANGPATLWDVPLLSMKSRDLSDSAIVIYWKEQPLAAGAGREVGFEYGLWTIASQGSQLAATVDGAFRPDGELTVVAYARQSADKEETLTLTLPEGLEHLGDRPKTQVVPKLSGDAKRGNLPVTWRVKAGAAGKYQITVTSSAGPTQTIPVVIRSAIFD